jgi:gluconolactonase
MRYLIFFTIMTLCISGKGMAQSDKAASIGSGIIASGATPELITDQFSFTEGPATNAQGEVFFTDQPNDRRMKWSEEDGVTEFLSPSGRANGLYFDREGNLLAAADGDNALWSITSDGSYTEIARRFDGKEFNGPNDLWVHPGSGDIYFTDPLYPRDYWAHRNGDMQQDGEHLYLLRAGQKRIIRIADDIRKPNGIIGTPDGKTLYVADIGANKTYVYDISGDGTLTNKRLFTSKGSDGLTIDSEGNVYITGRGVTVFNSAGEQIEQIDIPENWTANVTFGGKDRKILIITASKSLYSLRMNVKGVN